MLDEIMQLEKQLCFTLYTASRAMTRAYGPLLEPLGLTYPQYLVMLALWEGDGTSVKSLGERLDLDSGTLTPLLKRLESQNLVARRRSQIDERVVAIFLTDAGIALQDKAKDVPLALACKAGFSDMEGYLRLRSIREQMKEIVATLRKTDGKIDCRVDSKADGKTDSKTDPQAAAKVDNKIDAQTREHAAEDSHTAASAHVTTTEKPNT